MAKFNTIFSVSDLFLSTNFSVNSETISTKLENYIEIDKSSDIYAGEYEVIPKAYQSQTLDTKDKLLKEDITVFQVPFFKVDNAHGQTVTIGGDLTNGSK